MSTHENAKSISVRVFSLAEKIECLQREIRLRKRTYPSKVAHRRMTQAKADREIAILSEILREYENLLAQEDLFQPKEQAR